MDQKCDFLKLQNLLKNKKISIQFNYTLDDSYTPATICLRAGTNMGDLQDIRVVTFDTPNGWITFDISAELQDDSQD